QPLPQFGRTLARIICPEFVKSAEFASQRGQRLTSCCEDYSVATRRDWEAVVEIPCTETPGLGIETKTNLSLLKDQPVMIAQYGQQNSTLEIRPNCVPVDVEIARERRLSSPFENIEPPRVVAADTHVVWDKIEDQTHTVHMQRIDKRPEVGLRADFRI